VVPPAAAPVVAAPPAPVAVAAPAVEAAPAARTHTVKKHETLGKLAAKYYGRSSDWTKIAAANPQVGPDGAKLAVGMELTIPAK
jgi:nucleoid-associated protein YgaU